jgi:hypothetical protein
MRGGWRECSALLSAPPPIDFNSGNTYFDGTTGFVYQLDVTSFSAFAAGTASMVVTDLSGGGSRYVCVDNSGTLYALDVG